MSKFDEQIQSLVEAGQMTPEAAEAVRDASTVRRDAETAQERAAAAEARAEAAEAKVLASTFRSVGIKAKPSALNLPKDLTPDDEDAVRAWAVDNGFLDPPPPKTDSAELAEHERQAQASAGAEGTDGVDVEALVANAKDEAELDAIIAAHPKHFHVKAAQ